MTAPLKILFDLMQNMSDAEIELLGRKIDWHLGTNTQMTVKQTGTEIANYLSPIAQLIEHPSIKLKQVLLRETQALAPGKNPDVGSYTVAIDLALNKVYPPELELILKAIKQIGDELLSQDVGRHLLSKLTEVGNDCPEHIWEDWQAVKTLVEDFIKDQPWLLKMMQLSPLELKEMINLSLTTGRIMARDQQGSQFWISQTTTRAGQILELLVEKGDIKDAISYEKEMKPKRSPSKAVTNQVQRNLGKQWYSQYEQDDSELPTYVSKLTDRVQNTLARIKTLEEYINQKHPKLEEGMEVFLHETLQPTPAEFGRAAKLVPKAKQLKKQLEIEATHWIDWAGTGVLDKLDKSGAKALELLFTEGETAYALPESQHQLWLTKAAQWQMPLSEGEIIGLLTRNKQDYNHNLQDSKRNTMLKDSLTLIQHRITQTVKMGQQISNPWPAVIASIDSGSVSTKQGEADKVAILMALWHPLNQLSTTSADLTKTIKKLNLSKSVESKIRLDLSLPEPEQGKTKPAFRL